MDTNTTRTTPMPRQHSTDMIARSTLEGTYLYASPACQTLLGFAPEELNGRSVYEFTHPGDLDTLKATYAATPGLPRVRVLTCRSRRKDGTYIWLETVSRTGADNCPG